MSRPVVKICGVSTIAHARIAAEAGADMVGLIFAQSRRQITVGEAGAITAADYTRRPRFVGVFVNESPEAVARLAGEVRLDLAQLSGDEAPDACARLRVPYYKVVHVCEGMRAEEILHIADRYANAVGIVLDTAGGHTVPAGPARWGGTGIPVDWTLAAEVTRRLARPVILAGGLRPETVAEAIGMVRPWGVDVSSGVETGGMKDERKIRAFVSAADSCGPRPHGPTVVKGEGS